jgi:hypothetical protein
MHVIQYVATQADSKDEAHSNVKQYLQTNMGETGYDNWYDWFVTGGGRWASNPEAQYDDDYTGDVVHQSEAKFEEYLDTAHKYRQQELSNYEAEARKLNLTELLDNLQDFEFDLYSVGSQLYPVKKIYDMCMGLWDYNSYFMDSVHDSTNRKYMRESIDKGANNWYIVPVDFHF